MSFQSRVTSEVGPSLKARYTGSERVYSHNEIVFEPGSILGRHSTASVRIRNTHGIDPFEHDDDLNLACSASHGDARAPLDRRLLRTERYSW